MRPRWLLAVLFLALAGVTGAVVRWARAPEAPRRVHYRVTLPAGEALLPQLQAVVALADGSGFIYGTAIEANWLDELERLVPTE